VSRLSTVAAPALLLALLIGLWAGICSLFNLPAYLLPTPWAVAEALVMRAPQLGSAALQTIWMAVQALLLSSLLGGGLAVLLSLSRTAERAARPLAIALQVTPIVAIAPLVQIWVGLDRADMAVVILAACVAFFPIFSGVLTGLKSADPDLERLFDLYGASRVQRLVRLRLPSAVPFAFEGLRVAAGLAVIGAVVAEFVAGTGATQGLAWRLLEAANRLRTAEMIAALVWLAALGLSLNGLIALTARYLAPDPTDPRSISRR
jgi:NitT/TauT family transport system permease protein